MTPFAIAGIQMYVNALQPNTEGMLHRLDILMARFPWTQMVLFSELAPLGPLHRFALPLDNEHVAQFQAAARRHNVWLIPGSMFEKTPDGRVFNTSVVIAPDGSLVSTYRKMFPFRPYEADVEAGTEFCVFDVPEVGRFGLSICYDVRFAHLYRKLAKAGAEILLVPAAFSPVTGEAHWEPLLRARAIENGCFVLAAAQTGDHPIRSGKPRVTHGHSMVIGPWGNVMVDAGTETGIVYADIDLGEVARARGRVPSLTHDRPFEGP